LAHAKVNHVASIEQLLEADSPIVMVSAVATLGRNHANYGSQLKQTLNGRLRREENII
jgi:hypothetical protein